MKIKVTQKEESKLEVYDDSLFFIAHELMLCYERIMIPSYQLATGKYCNYQWEDGGERFYNKIVPAVDKALANSNDEHLIKLKTLLKLMDDLPTTYFGFDKNIGN
ncbi:hypothetical protein SAMN05443550_10718 [Pedobacter hartonius]|uniref:Uncharacterized protein n=2 Tax=Pedobacter hartonius TaxID=425514 RepID=A0A1H4F5J1_9SPHI|nr:hypothetical protein SAMN05443550_10718 [Pedobacter hartonius]